MGNTVGQGEEDRCDCGDGYQLVQEADRFGVLLLWRRCGAHVKKWESSFIVMESTLRFSRRRRQTGDDACDGVEDDGGGDIDVESLLRPAADRGT